MIAFLSAWANNTTPREAAAYVHFGMTSSDLLDTALALQLAEATDLLIARCERLLAGAARPRPGAPRRRCGWAGRTASTPSLTSGGTGSPTSRSPLHRCRDRLLRARQSVAVGKLSGPVGTYSNIDPAIEAEVLAELGLRPADVATQVVLRDGIAEWVSVLALIATVCEAIAIEVRHGQRTEVAELAEPFGAGQKGSSAMPHKRNPVRAERISGLARIVRAQVVPVMEGIPLWHERDISHSSTERVALPDAAIATDYLLEQTTGVMDGLVVDAARMLANLESSHGLIYTSAVLLELVDAGHVQGGRLRAGAEARPWTPGSPACRLPARRCASTPPCGARTGRGAPGRGLHAPSATSPGSAPSSTGWSGSRDQRRVAGTAEPRCYSGKVRELYQADDGVLLLVATDRISAFDYVLDTPIPDKGKILTQLSLWWFERLADVVPNHLVDAPIPAEFAGRAMACMPLSMVPVECVARGYLTGSGLADYRRDGAVAGIALPAGLTDGSRLPEPIFDPDTKAPQGQHDENITFGQLAAWSARTPRLSCARITLAVYQRGAELAAERGIIVADTKIELGFDAIRHAAAGRRGAHAGLVQVLAGRPWQPGRSQVSFDKQFVRDWLTSPASGWDRNCR